EQTTVFGKYEIDGLVVNVIKNKYKNSFGKWQRIWTFLTFLIIACFFQMKKREFDVIYATSTPLTIAIPAMFLSWKGKVPFVFEVRDLWPEAPYQLGFIKSPFIYKSLCILETQIYKKAKHVVALSPGMKEGIMSKKIPERKITVIPNSADLELFKTQSTGKYRNLFNLGDKFVLAHIGSMGVINGLDYLIEAARKLKDCDEKEVVILIVGEGAKKVELKSLVNRYELDNVYIMDSLPKHEIPTLMADVDATIMSVKHHPVLEMASPNKFFDSLAAGKPVLVNCEGWMKELVEKHEIGM
ncbi:glycosyltransferase family 4 protein, partial [Listeria welshimeri]|nr:glycosyltransferase family 4 protein [Listeria welshimeri]